MDPRRYSKDGKGYGIMIDNIIVQRSTNSKGVFRISRGETDEINEIYVRMVFADILRKEPGNPKHIMLGFVISKNDEYIYEHDYMPDLLVEANGLYQYLREEHDRHDVESMVKPYIDMLFRKIINLDFCDFTEKDLFVIGSPIKLSRIVGFLQDIARQDLAGEPESVETTSKQSDGDNAPVANVMLKRTPKTNIVALTSIAKPNEPQPIYIKAFIKPDPDNEDSSSSDKYVVVDFWAGVTSDCINYYLGDYLIGPTDEDGTVQTDINGLFDDVMKKIDVYEMSGHAYTRDNFTGQVKTEFTKWIGERIRKCINRIEDDD